MPLISIAIGGRWVKRFISGKIQARGWRDENEGQTNPNAGVLANPAALGNGVHVCPVRLSITLPGSLKSVLR